MAPVGWRLCIAGPDEGAIGGRPCGWWIGTEVGPLVLALRTAIALSDEEGRAMGEHGRVYVQRYDWNAIAVETLALYRWM